MKIHKKVRKFRLVLTFDDYDPIVLGVLHLAVSEAAGKLLIRKLWEEFQGTNPDVDSDFVQYLRNKGYPVPEDDVTDVELPS